ncbi:RagB/SusD family nutrient uptake outer membrane protein [Sphingobacterium sp. N143]|uniref:RagB/SusD family nutrient uptake outer membrane protein n=1 Tax=Sphingobacterium sp. N143 TaxID=2746727 RepID=UPI002576635F|nr:RagB/SusD family nutrient uptake outer membrane protein [Sphingobacterium sp. N143]MDM1296159.1 RagB/SusD family nutrient uptake outer membrane protein [Sphingobacterium sp. N143]
MKKIIYALLVALSCTACNDLDLNPNDRPSSGTFWQTQEDFDLALTASYGSMRRSGYSTTMPCWDNLTDNAYGQHAEGQYGMTTNMVQGSLDPTSSGFVSDTYLGALQDVARVNIFLSKLKEFAGFDEDSKKRYEAEARMIRAFYYSFLYRSYGEVPIVSEPLTLETQYQEKKPADDVYKFMMDDIDFAITNLPENTFKAAKGRWTKDVAKAYKARMILYTAYNDAGQAIQAKMKEAKTLLSEISGYSLANDFADNFNDAAQEASPEIMMSVKFLAPNASSSADMWYGEWVVSSPLINFIEEFEMLDGSPGLAVPKKGTSKFTINSDVFTNASLTKRDPRLAKTVFIDKYVINGVAYTPSNARPTGAGVSKFLSQNQIAPFGYSTLSQQDWVIMRYADVLLMLAEAENELNGPTALVYTSLDAIRKRAGMPKLPEGLTKDVMRQKIRHERRVELAFEGQHYFDLKRWKTAKTVLNAVQDAPVVYKFEDKHYLWPLPQSEIDKNQGILVQNPNYK